MSWPLRVTAASIVVDVAFEYAGVRLSDHGNGGQGGGVMFAIGGIGGIQRESGGNQGGKQGKAGRILHVQLER